MDHDNDQPDTQTDSPSEQGESTHDQASSSHPSGSSPSTGLAHHRSVPQGSDEQEPLDAEPLDPDVAQQIGQRVLSVTRSGPLPTVDEFRGYDGVVDGAADRILRMAELSAEAAADATSANAEATRAEAQATLAGADSVRQDSDSVKRGQIIFAILSVVCIIASTVLGVAGMGAASIAPLVAGVISGFGVLIRPVNPSRWRNHGESTPPSGE